MPPFKMVTLVPYFRYVVGSEGFGSYTAFFLYRYCEARWVQVTLGNGKHGGKRKRQISEVNRCVFLYLGVLFVSPKTISQDKLFSVHERTEVRVCRLHS